MKKIFYLFFIFLILPANMDFAKKIVVQGNNNRIKIKKTVINGKKTTKKTKTSYPISPLTHTLYDLTADELFGRIGWATHINNQGHVCGNTSHNYLFKWDKTNGFDFFPDERWSKGLYAGCPPFINEAGIVSIHPITDTNEIYKIDQLNRLLKNDKIIDDKIVWLEYKTAVNNKGQFLANIKISPEKNELVIWNDKDQTITYVNKGLKFNIYPADINDKGWVVGWFDDDRHQENGVFWTPVLGATIIPNFCPSAINNNGVIVGSIRLDNGYRRAVVWFDGQLTDISDALNISSNPQTDLLWISEISDINDRGDMVGWGFKGSGHLQQAVAILTK